MRAGRDRKAVKGARVRRAVIAAAAALLLFAMVAVDLFFFPLSRLRALVSAPDIPARAEGELRIHFIDVGQGDCTVVEFPDGSVMIADGGDGSAASDRAVLAYCCALGVDTFDVLLLTHPDTDHCGGLAEVLRTFGAERIFLPFRAPAEGEEAYAEFVAAAEASGAELTCAQALLPLLFEGGYGMFLSPFSPEVRPLPEEDNDASAVLYIEYAGRRFLMTGDASSSVEEEIADAFLLTEGEAFSRTVRSGGEEVVLSPDLSGIDFLKAGHHGSSSSSCAAFLGLCRPREVFFSCGAGNGYGHPNLSALSRVRAASPEAGLWRTDELGNILLTLRADGSYTVEAVG